MQNIALGLIDTEQNDRTRPTAIDELASSMKQVGLLQPIGVRKAGARFTVTYGHRRLEAARLLGWKEIACIVEQEGGNVRQRRLIENCQREGLSWLEFGAALKGLQDETGWTGAQLAESLGKSEATVSKHMAVQTLAPDALAKLEGMAFSAAYAIATASPDKQAELIAAAMNGASRDAIAGAARRPKSSKSEAKGSKCSRVRCPLTTGYTVTVEGESLDTDTLIEALEGVLGQARKARTQGVEVTTLGRMFRDMARG